jgi:hypothetical protein
MENSIKSMVSRVLCPALETYRIYKNKKSETGRNRSNAGVL